MTAWTPVDITALVGGLVGLVGGLTGLWSALRPPRMEVAHLDRLGFVVGPDKELSKAHLPLVVSNQARKPGVITGMGLTFEGVESHDTHEFSWALFWNQDFACPRKPDSYASPIPVPGFTSAERNIEFHSRPSVKWRPETYKCSLSIRVGRKQDYRIASVFYIRLSEKRATTWNAGCGNSRRVDDIPIFMGSKDPPQEGS